MNQGWILILLTAVTTISGCAVVYTDSIYRLLFPRLYRNHPFVIQKNTSFLVATLSLSSGSLLFTSLNRLLPQSSKYFSRTSLSETHPQLPQILMVLFFFVGIICCSLLNLVIHFFTNESIVHCVHDEEHGSDTSSLPEMQHVNETTPLLDCSKKIHDHSTSSDNLHHHSAPHDIHSHPSLEPKKMSLVDMSLKTLKGKELEGQCLGSIDACQDELIARHKLHDGKGLTHEDLHFCTLPSQENLMFFTKDREMIVQKSDICSRFPELEVNSPLLVDDVESGSLHNKISHKDFSKFKSHSTHSLQDHHSHEHFHNNNDLSYGEHHHHHIQTPLSKLLSIGLQTVLAITLHKFPEGFIMYSTSQADPNLGIAIFLSMFIHNFVEGFTMTLPLSIALNSKSRAFFISGILGACAQPIGALLGWVVFKGDMNLDLDANLLLFGSLIALTSGFLTFIGFQMVASAVGFGGQQEKVLAWSFLGILLICVSNILIAI